MKSGYSRKQVFENPESIFHISSDYRYLYRKRFQNANGTIKVIEESVYEQIPIDKCGKILQNIDNHKIDGNPSVCNGVLYNLHMLIDKVNHNCVGFILSQQTKENISKSKFYVVKEMIK